MEENELRQLNKRNGKIEFFRFIFCLIVAIFHGKTTMTDGKIRIMFSGRLGVEFFFLVSGYLMAASVNKILANREQINVGRETEAFLLHKYCSLYPVVAIAFFMNLITSAWSLYTPLRETLIKMIQGIPSLFLLHNTGIGFYSINGTWYLSAMLISMAILFPLLLKFPSFMRRVGILGIGTLVLGFLMMNTKNLAGPANLINGLVYKGNLRAFSEIALGAFAYEIAKELREVPFRKSGKIVLAVLEFVLYAVAIMYMIFGKPGKMDFLIVMVLLCAVTISFSEAAWGSEIFNNRFCCFLGTSSLYIYLAHLSAAKDLTPIVGTGAGNKVRMLVFLALTCVLTAVLWALTIACKHLGTVLKKALIEERDPTAV